VGSTKSYDYVRQHIEATATIDFVPEMTEIKATYNEGDSTQVKMHDGSFINLHKLANDWNPLDRQSAMNAVLNAKQKNEILTGLLYIQNDSTDLHQLLETADTPLNKLTETELCPGPEALLEINKGLR
jgi:2-oxoglutarate ferredoxin oxidoreductase subunit beta